MAKPLILITNDDGITAPGIRILTQIASKYGEVVVVAPDSPQSGQGHAITLEDPIRKHPTDIFKDIEAYECSGTPSDCVKLAKYFLDKQNRPIQFCFSGINHGSNAGVNVVYSGTMSAAMEASLNNIPSVGFSLLEYTWDANFEEAAVWVEKIIKEVITNGMGDTHLLNVNIPAKSETPIKGIKVCRQANSRWVETFQEGKDPHNRPYFWLTGNYVADDAGEGTDIHALDHNYVAIVPCKHDLTKHKALPSLAHLEQLT